MAAVTVLGAAAPAAAQVCSTFSLVGNFAITFGGINAAGRDTTVFASVSLDAANALGMGQVTGAMFVNERGSALQEVPVAGTYQVFTNCVVHLFIPDGTGRTATLTGLAVETGQFISLASVFDAAVQLTGTARKFPVARGHVHWPSAGVYGRG